MRVQARFCGSLNPLCPTPPPMAHLASWYSWPIQALSYCAKSWFRRRLRHRDPRLTPSILILEHSLTRLVPCQEYFCRRSITQLSPLQPFAILWLLLPSNSATVPSLYRCDASLARIEWQSHDQWQRNEYAVLLRKFEMVSNHDIVMGYSW